MALFEFEIAGTQYRGEKLDPFKQLHLTRKIGPVVPKLFPMLQKLQGGVSDDLGELVGAAGPFMEALASMPEADVDYVVKTSLGSVRRQQGGVWAPMVSGDTLMVADLGLEDLLPIVTRVLRENLGNFIRGLFASEAVQSIQGAPAAA